MNSNRKFFILASYSALIFTLWSMHVRAQEHVLVSARLLGEAKDFIEFSVKNNSKVELCIHKGDLPWGSLYSTTLSLYVTGESNRSIERIWSIDDPPSGFICLGPGVVSKGRVNLSNVFPSIRDERTKRDLVLFWFYRNKSLSLQGGGYFLLPAEKAQEKEPGKKEYLISDDAQP